MTRSTPPLEQRARASLARQGDEEADERLSVPELRHALHELHVHQIELELQNEELRTTQHQLEESRAALATSEYRYHELFERAPVGYLRVGRNGAILEVNDTGVELLRCVKSRLVNRRLTDFITPESQEAYYHFYRAVLEGEDPGTAAVALRAAAGDTRDVEIGGCLVEGDADEIRIVILDVTARTRAEAKHYESERQRRLMADSLPLAVGYVGADGRLDFCNRAFGSLFSASTNAIEGAAIFDVLDPDVYAAWREHVREALSGHPARFEGELSFPKIGRRSVSAFFAPDLQREGLACGFYLLMDDRTGLERARSGLRQAAAQAALAEERERRVLAADLHDDAGQLLSLASIKLQALSATAAGTGLAPPIQEVADLMREAREAISSLSFELSPPVLYDVGFFAAAEWLVESVRERYGLQTKLSRSDEIPDLEEATRVTLFRALRELLINVAKHAGTGRAAVTIQGGPDKVTVVVGDAGLGFDPKSESRGFGLRNVLDRIESLGGRVVIDAAPGAGSTVAMTVPAEGKSP